MHSFKLRKTLAALAAAVPLTLLTQAPTLAASGQSQQSQQQGQQQKLSEATDKLGRAQQTFEQGAQGDRSKLKQAKSDAEKALGDIEKAAKKAQKSGNEQAKQAAQDTMDRIDGAKRALKESEDQPKPAAQALQEVKQSAEKLEQQLAQGGSSGKQASSQQSGGGSASEIVDHSKQAAQENRQLAREGETLVGKDLYGAENKKVGEVENVVMGEDGKVKAVLVEVGGFIGIGGKKVAIPTDQLQIQSDRVVASSLTKESAKSMPEYKEKEERRRVSQAESRRGSAADGGAGTLSGAAARSSASSSQADGGAAASLSSQDKEFVEKAAKGSAAEIELGKLAQQQGQSQEVKQLGEKLVNDHQDAKKKLEQIASSKGVDVPSEPDKSAQKEIDRLQKLSGDAFDSEFLKHTAQEHKKTIDLFQKEAKSGKNQELQSYAENTLPKLKEHEKIAQSARQSAVGDGGSSTAKAKQQQEKGDGGSSTAKAKQQQEKSDGGSSTAKPKQ